MPVTSIADLYEAGFDFEVAQFLEGNVSRVDSIQALAFRTFGSDWQGTIGTLTEFVGQVRAAMTAADNLTEAGLPPGFVIPGVPLRDGGEPIREIGYAVGNLAPGEEGEGPSEIRLPVVSDRATVATPSELLDELLADPELISSPPGGTSPRLQRRLQELNLERLADTDRNWEIAVTRIYRNTLSR